METDAKHWNVTRDGASGTVALSSQGVEITVDGEVLTITWSSRPTVQFPTPYSVDIGFDGAQCVLGFRSTSEQREFRSALSDMQAEVTAAGAAVTLPRVYAWADRVPMTTLPMLYGQSIVADHGLVTANVAMSRGQLSDFGSELKSFVGGNLGGIEKAVATALDQVRGRLSDEARAAGGNAVVGVSLAFTSSERVGAELIVIVGTAVTALPQTAPEPS